MISNSSKGTPSQASAYDDEVQGPAIITPMHAHDRTISKVAGAHKAWRKLTQLTNAYMQERLGAKGSNEARDRLAAGEFYTKLWDIAQRASRDSTAAFYFDGGGQGGEAGEACRAALARLVAIENRLGRRDCIIIRGVCGLGHSPAEAVTHASCGKLVHVTSRLCEALDSLKDAIECTQKRGRRE